jgi:hypothetical protein
VCVCVGGGAHTVGTAQQREQGLGRTLEYRKVLSLTEP